MRNMITWILLVLLFLQPSTWAAGAQQPAPMNLVEVQKIKAEVGKRAFDHRLARVNLKDGSELRGTLTNVGDEGFSIVEAKTGKQSGVLYTDVKSVRGAGLSTGAKVGIGVGIGAAVAAVVLFAIFHALSSD